jgi:hypothetical protein
VGWKEVELGINNAAFIMPNRLPGIDKFINFRPRIRSSNVLLYWIVHGADNEAAAYIKKIIFFTKHLTPVLHHNTNSSS